MTDFHAATEAVPEPGRQIVERFLATLARTTDPTLVVLRSHLLLEELLWKGITSALPHSAHLKSVRLNFSRLTALFKALHGDGGRAQQPTWQFLTRLNTLRNDLAHTIDVPQLERAMDELTALQSVSIDTKITQGHERAYLFTLAVASVGGRLSSVLSTTSRARTSGDPGPG